MPYAVSLQLVETPPRMWGILLHDGAVALSQGNTPTHVGNTYVRPSSPFKKRKHPTHVGNTDPLVDNDCIPKKHPHACGEYHIIPLDDTEDQETPPRMWGILRFESD